MHVSDDICNPERVNDDICNPMRVNYDICSPVCVSNDISGPIRLWHVSPIKLRHVSLTHSQTSINRSLPKAFGEILRRVGEETPRFKSTEALLKPSPEASKNFKNFAFESKEHSKRNHPNHLPRSQRSLEPNFKASKNFKNFNFEYEEHLKRNHISKSSS